MRRPSCAILSASQDLRTHRSAVGGRSRTHHGRFGIPEGQERRVPDETRTFDNGKVDIVSIDEVTAGRFTLEPGWRWSENVEPIVGRDSCQVLHTGYVVSGRMHLVHDDGSDRELGPGDVYIIRPGTTPGSWERRPTSGSTSPGRRSATPRKDEPGRYRSGNTGDGRRAACPRKKRTRRRPAA